MAAFVDNDIVHKLCALDLVDAGLDVLRELGGEVWCLSTAKYRFFVAKDIGKARKKYGANTADRIASVLGSLEEISDAHDDDVETLGAIPGIDAGELILFSAAYRKANSVLVTGDKRSLYALAGARGCEELVAGLRGRVVCLEQLILQVVQLRGCPYVRGRIVPNASVDTAMRSVFSSLDADVKHVEDGLRSYIDALRARTGDLLSD